MLNTLCVDRQWALLFPKDIKLHYNTLFKKRKKKTAGVYRDVLEEHSNCLQELEAPRVLDKVIIATLLLLFYLKCCLCSKVDAVQDGRLGCLVSWYPVYYSIYCYLLEQIKLNTTINNNLGVYNNIWDILEAKNVCIFKNFHTGEYFIFKLVRQTIKTWQ